MSRFTLTGSRACGPCPEPSSVASVPLVASAKRRALRVRPDPVFVAVQHEHRAAYAGADVAEALEAAEVEGLGTLDQRLRSDLETPGHAVLDLLRRVGLGEDLREEVLEELPVVLEPVVAVVLRPALVGVEPLVERVDVPLGVPGGERDGGADEDRAGDPIGMVGGEQRAPEGAAGEADHDGRLGPGRVHDGERVLGEFVLGVGGDPARTVGLPVPAAVEGEHAEVAGEVGDLHLPVARVDDRPGREEEHCRLALPVDLVEDADAVALDVALFVRVAGAGLLARRDLDRRRQLFRLAQPAVDPVQELGVAVLEPPQPFEDDPLVEGDHERDERVERHRDPVLLARLRERLGEDRAPFVVNASDALLELGPVPGERLQLVPDLLVLAVGVEVAHRRPPLLGEGDLGVGVHRSLPHDQPLREPLEHADEQALDRAEVIVDEPVVHPGLGGELPGRDARVADLDEQTLGRVEERPLRGRAGYLRRSHRIAASSLARPKSRTPVATVVPPAASEPSRTCSPMWCARITGRSPSCSRLPGAAPRAPARGHRGDRRSRRRSPCRPPSSRRRRCRP